MKKLIVAITLLLSACSASCSISSASPTKHSQDAGVDDYNARIKREIIHTTEKYYPRCVMQCYRYTGDPSCQDRCQEDFKQVFKVLIRADRDKQLVDFYEMMDSMYPEVILRSRE